MVLSTTSNVFKCPVFKSAAKSTQYKQIRIKSWLENNCYGVIYINLFFLNRIFFFKYEVCIGFFCVILLEFQHLISLMLVKVIITARMVVRGLQLEWDVQQTHVRLMVKCPQIITISCSGVNTLTCSLYFKFSQVLENFACPCYQFNHNFYIMTIGRCSFANKFS